MFETVIRNAYKKTKASTDIGFKQNVILLLDKIEHSPVGIGQGHFWINGAFVNTVSFSFVFNSIAV